MAGRKLATLMLNQKIELIDEMEKKGKKQKDVAHDFEVLANMVLTIKKSKDQYRNIFYSGQANSNRQRQLLLQHDDIEKKIPNWFTDMRAANVPIMKTKAEELAHDLVKKIGHASIHCFYDCVWQK